MSKSDVIEDLKEKLSFHMDFAGEGSDILLDYITRLEAIVQAASFFAFHAGTQMEKGAGLVNLIEKLDALAQLYEAEGDKEQEK